jgi:hypothetical protein
MLADVMRDVRDREILLRDRAETLDEAVDGHHRRPALIRAIP